MACTPASGHKQRPALLNKLFPENDGYVKKNKYFCNSNFAEV